MLRLPFVRRSRLETERERRRHLALTYEQQFEELLFRVARAQDDRQKAIDGAQAANERADAAFRDCAKLITDLRAVIWNVGMRPDDQHLEARLTIPSELLWHSFRWDRTFRTALAYQIEYLIHSDPELSRSILSWGLDPEPK